MEPVLKLKRVYEPPVRSDGYRILIDGLWPRGVSKRAASIHSWVKTLAPSTALRRWFRHDPELWPEFVKRYRRELKSNKGIAEFVNSFWHLKQITLLYAASDEAHNHALVLKDFLENHYKPKGQEEYKDFHLLR